MKKTDQNEKVISLKYWKKSHPIIHTNKETLYTSEQVINDMKIFLKENNNCHKSEDEENLTGMLIW